MKISPRGWEAKRTPGAVCVILGLIIVFGARPLYGLVNNEVSFNTGMYLYEETAVVKDIDLDSQEISVIIKNSDTYLRSDPYKDEDICLDCSKVKVEVLKKVEISDEIVFTHLYVEPYTAQDIKDLM